MKKLLTCLLGLFMALTAQADEGMWLPSLIGSRIGDMRSKGFELTAEDIYSINQASLKDAIVRFGKGCTGELVSEYGLLLTNHHCGYGQIQKHSTVEHDYLTNGFWAMNQAEELPNQGLTVTFLVRMEDVTDQVTTKGGRDAKKVSKVIDKATKGTHYNASVESLYYGNQYFLFVYEVFEDVRLVGAPPSSIGKFGGDTDNWMWPRHTGDFSIFRIYADKDNKPAPYSKDNVPYRPKKHFEISTAGFAEGDFTFVYGFPGRTYQYIISDAVDYIQNYSNPAKIGLRTIRLDIIKAAQDADPEIRIAYAAKSASIANAWKKWQGESLGLKRLGTIAEKQEYEERFQAWADGKAEYRNVLAEQKALYAELHRYAYATDYYNEAILATELLKHAIAVSPYVPASDIGDKYSAFYKDYSPAIDRAIAKRLIGEYLANMPEEYIPELLTDGIKEKGSLEAYIDYVFDTSKITRIDGLTSAGKDDPAIKLALAFRDVYTSLVSSQFKELNKQITNKYKTFMRGIMEFDKQRAFYPDANSTLRVAYGRIEGYRPADAVWHMYESRLEGIIEKDDPEIYDYNIPQELRDIYADGDYGRWADGGKLPVCFIGTNHTTGGNSGSPVLNGKGQLIGLNFDRTWLSTMSDIEFDSEMCRNIAVDIRYVLFVIDKIGNASYLIDEMDFAAN